MARDGARILVLAFATLLLISGLADACISQIGKARQSGAYWAGASPFGIQNARQFENGTLILEIQNNAPETLILKSINMSYWLQKQENFSFNFDEEIKHGEKTVLILEMPACNNDREDRGYSLSNIVYGKPGSDDNFGQMPARDLDVVCSGKTWRELPPDPCTSLQAPFSMLWFMIAPFNLLFLVAGVWFYRKKREQGETKGFVYGKLLPLVLFISVIPLLVLILTLLGIYLI